MNYVIVVVAIVLIMWVSVWVFDGRYRFEGPRDMEARLNEGRK